MEKLKLRSNETKGFLITFCGLDGCGKTTMLTRLAQDLKNSYALLLTKQPTDLVRDADCFRTYMDFPDHSAYEYRSVSLFAASDRLQHSNKVIEPAMQQGKIVLCDRYFYSCLANLRARGYEKDKWIYEIATTVVKPDAAFFFDVPVETAVRRVRSRTAEKERYIDIALQHRLREEYLIICSLNGGILIHTEENEEKCYAAVKSAVERILKI